MIIVGCDLSMNGTGLTKLTLDDTNLDVVDIDYKAWCTVKKHTCEQVIHYKKKDYDDRMEVNIWMEEGIADFIKDADYIAIEDYAFGASGNVIDIGEFIGYVKACSYKDGHTIRLYDPNSIKKFATMSGKADKVSMYLSTKSVFTDIDNIVKGTKNEGFLQSLPIPKSKGGVSPTSDLIDAYWIAMLLRLELQLRKGLIQLHELGEIDISIFNRCTKANPTNILVRPFLSKN